MNRSGADVVRFLFQQGEMVTTTQSLSDDMIELFAAELGADIRLVDPGEEKEAELQAKYFDDEEEDDEDLRPRPPVVTVMGHVDHGKTLLLDRIRETNVVAGEAGGITQHIGAYQVTYNGQLITFIDTPGHEAFTAMRARGAEVTDIVILVAAADDGVMPQTVEAINHAKAADVPIIVAINKIDRAEADPNRVMQQLSEQGLVPEAWGGDTIMVEISALQNLGIEELLEQVLLVAELEELQANPEGRARGIVLEANLDAGKGPVATVIVQSGTLRVSDSVVAGASWGRVKALLDDNGDNVKEASPSTPVQILGFDIVPSAGDEFRVTDKAKTARDIAEQREQRYRAVDQRRTSSATGTGAKLEDIFEQIQRGETATLNLVLKADTQGSLEAVTESLRKLERDEVKLSFIHRAVGGITENDVSLAEASNATIIGFNVRPDRGARELAETHDVEIRTYEIIYKLIEDIESAMVGMLAPEFEEVITGEAEVREIFRVPRVGAIAGCYVRHGVITRGSKVRFLRDGVIIWKGAITSLKRFKDDVREVHEGFECGIGLSNNQDLRQGDVIETYEEREIPRT
ncbi:MAG TPA: translation initiation factor IF-2 [Acidimicrobiales bacterium]